MTQPPSYNKQHSKVSRVVPISPDDPVLTTMPTLPDVYIEVVNELIKEKWDPVLQQASILLDTIEVNTVIKSGPTCSIPRDNITPGLRSVYGMKWTVSCNDKSELTFKKKHENRSSYFD